jgi:hypothetical protein
MTSVDEHIEGIRARGEDRESDGCARHAPEPAGHDTPGGILHVTGASTNGSEEFLPQRDKRADDFCKTCVPRHNMSFNCVEMSLLISVTVSSSCLFSYTFRLRSSFINIFFFVPALNATNPPPPRPWNFPLRWMICPVFFASVWAFVLSLGDPVGALRSAPVPAILA